MIAMLRLAPRDTAVLVAESSFFPLFHRDFQPFLSPKSIHTFEVHTPAFLPELASDHPVAIARKLADQLQDSMDQSWFVVSLNGLVTLRTA